MSVELIKDLFKVEEILSENIAQTIVEGDILVPDTKPDITRILSVEAKLGLSKQRVEDGKIAIEGITYFKILYACEKDEQPLYSIDSSTDFKQDIEIEGISSEMKVEVEMDIEHIDFTINNERKVGVKAIVNITGKAIEEKIVEITRDIIGLEDIQLLKESFQYTDIVGINKSEALIKDGFELDEEEYEIKEILKWDATVLERETKITDGKVIVGGLVNLDLLYVDEEYDNQLKTRKMEIPFTHFVDMIDALSHMQYKLKLSVDELYYDIKENIRGENKIVEIECVVKIETKVMDTQSREILVDTYSPSKELKITKEQIELKENIGVNRSNVLVRETIDKPSNHPPIAEVLSASVKPILADYNASTDKAIVEGILEVTVMYKALEGTQSLYSFTQEVPFRHYIEINGLEEDMETEVELFVEEVSYDIINGEQVEIRVNLRTICQAYCRKSIDIISTIEELEENIDLKVKPSLTVYFMQEEDTIWNLAKKYYTTVERIMETNEIEDPTTIKIGDHIIIEKIHNFNF